MNENINEQINQIEKDLEILRSDNSLLKLQYDNSMAILNSEHMIMEYKNQLTYLDSIAASNESSLVIGYIGTGIAESTKGFCDKFINLLGTAGGKNSPYNRISGIYEKTQSLVSARYADSKEESLAHLSSLVIPEGDAYSTLRATKELALAAFKNGDNAEFEKLSHVLKALAETTNNPIAKGIVNDMQANFEIMKGLHTIGQYSEEKEALLIRIAEEKAKINYRIAREKEKLSGLKEEEALLNNESGTASDNQQKLSLSEKVEKLINAVNNV